jgi:hypothetical protein
MRRVLLWLALLSGSCAMAGGGYTVAGCAYLERATPEGKAAAKVEVRYVPSPAGTGRPQVAEATLERAPSICR